MDISLPPSPVREVQPKVRKVFAIGDATERAHSAPTDVRLVPENPKALVPIQPGAAQGDPGQATGDQNTAQGDLGGVVALRNQDTALARARRNVVRPRPDIEDNKVLRVEELAAERERRILDCGRAAFTEMGNQFACEIGAAQAEMLQLRDQEQRAEL